MAQIVGGKDRGSFPGTSGIWEGNVPGGDSDKNLVLVEVMIHKK